MRPLTSLRDDRYEDCRSCQQEHLCTDRGVPMNFVEYRRVCLSSNGIASGSRRKVGLAFGGYFVELEFTHVCERWAQRQWKNHK